VAARTPRKPLSRERLLSAAVALADSAGLPAVTMRRLAADLGVEAMSLYHHLPNKDGLLDGLVETVVGEIQTEIGRLESTGTGADWRTAMRRRCLTAREVMLRHPWAPGLIGSRAIPPSAYLYYEGILATLVAGGFSYHLAHRALHALGSMPLGFVQEPFSPAPPTDGVDPSEEQMAEMAEALPHLMAMVAAELHAAEEQMLSWCDSQVEFEFTLDLLLDGLARKQATALQKR
jgi:AcrR family transcriptional regulator